MSIATEVSKLAHDAIVELFVLDATALGGSVMRFHNGTNKLVQAVVWQGLTYTYFPIEAEGFSQSADGPAPRPTLRTSNVLGLVGALVRQYKGLKGAKVTRKRTLARYLDAVNFPGSVNPTADPAAGYIDDVYAIDRCPARAADVVEFELASPMDVAGRKIPGRQITHHCPPQWIYRGANCGYSGPPVAKKDDTATTVLAEDVCGKRLSSCKLRQWPNNELAFGGFPAAGVVRNA